MSEVERERVRKRSESEREREREEKKEEGGREGKLLHVLNFLQMIRCASRCRSHAASASSATPMSRGT